MKQPTLVEDNQDRQKAWWTQVVDAATAAHGDSPQFETAVQIDLHFYFKRPQSHWLPANSKRPEAVLREGSPTYKSGLPDVDKLQRLVFDALTQAGIWADDKLAVSVLATKRYARPGELDGVTVQIVPIA